MKKEDMDLSTGGAHRKGISPVLATVILVAVTLIAAAAISGFIFGLMGTFTSTARVAAGSVSCSGTPEDCVVSLTNAGSANAALTGVCSISFNGQTYLSAAVLQSGSLSAGSNGYVGCTAPGSAHAPSGTQVVGSISLGNGAQVLFAGTAA